MDFDSNFSDDDDDYESVVHPVHPVHAIPVKIVLHRPTIIRRRSMSESDQNSGSLYVTPQQKRRRGGHQYNPRNRKISAPPELKAHLGQKQFLKTSYLSPAQSPQGTSPCPDSFENSSPAEFVINFNSNKLTNAANSGSDSGVTSEYSSWAVPIGSGRSFNSSPFGLRLHSRSISLEDIPTAGELPRECHSDSEVDEVMNSPRTSQSRADMSEHGISNPAYIPDNQPQKLPKHMVLPISAPSPVPSGSVGPHPFHRAQTDSSLLSSNSNIPGMPNARTRTNSMVFQLNLANGVAGMSNTLPNNARSVSMISLNTAANSGQNMPLNYTNLSHLNTDSQSVYSEAGLTHKFNPAFLGIGHGLGSTTSLSGAGFGHSIKDYTHLPHYNEDPHEHHQEAPETTDPEVKKKWTIDTLCENLSVMYAILQFMIGCVFYVADTFSGKYDRAMGEAFNVYLIIVQLIWLIYIHVDVRKYVNSIANALEEAKDQNAKGEPVQLETTPDGQYQLRINLPEPKKTFAQHYGFTSGRHGGSLYLKIGAAVFCLGYLIHAGLNLGQKVLYIIEKDPRFDSCTCVQDVLMSVLQPIYAFYILFFIYKYSNLIINRNKRLSRFALMHCISASLLFWVYTIIQETLQAITSKKAEKYANNYTSTPKYSSAELLGLGEEYESEELEDGEDHDSHVEYGHKYSSGLNVNYGCGMTTPLTKMINDTTPYLYPFSIEYNILIVGIWILLWENIGRMDRHTHLPSIEMTYEDDNTKGITSNLIIYVDCHSSNRGLFAGLLMTVATVISIILFFILTAHDSTKQHGLQLNGYSELIVHAIMIAAAVLAYFAIRNLDVVKHHVSSVDDILLYICLPCIFLYAVFSMVPAFKYGKILFVAVSIGQVVQAVIQTALIVDGLRRCSNSAALNAKKPGRELITFMIVANIALWLLETFEIKSKEGNYFKYDYYGKEAWTLLSHMTLPLALFYRFHSSVCLADIWKTGYEVEPEH